MTDQELLELLQGTYFDNIDTGHPELAIHAFTEDVEWIHTQVWEHDGHDRSTIDTLSGTDQVFALLQGRVPEMQTIQIEHKVRKALCDGESGAFRAEVVGPGGPDKAFIGWVELRGGKISKYVVYPER